MYIMQEDVVNMKETKIKETKIDENKNEEIKEVKLEDLFDIRVGVMLNRMPCNNNVETCKIKVLSFIGKKNEEEIDKSYVERLRETHKILEEGDFIVSLVSPYHVAYITKELAGCITSHFHAVLKPKNKENMNANYYYAALYCLSVNGKMSNCVNKETAITNIIALRDFKCLTIPVCDEERQIAVVRIFHQFQERIQLLQKIIEAEKNLIDAEKQVIDGLLTKSSNFATSFDMLKDLYDKWDTEFGKISSSWDDFLCDVINSTR